MCEAIIDAARSVPGAPAVVLGEILQEHERGIGHGYCEREAICRAGVDAARMARNLGQANGLIRSAAVMMRLSEQVGRSKSHANFPAVAHKVLDSGMRSEAALAHALPDPMSAPIPKADEPSTPGRP